MRIMRRIANKYSLPSLRRMISRNYCQPNVERPKTAKTKQTADPKVKNKKIPKMKSQETQDLQFFQKIEKIRVKEESKGRFINFSFILVYCWTYCQSTGKLI